MHHFAHPRFLVLSALLTLVVPACETSEPGAPTMRAAELRKGVGIQIKSAADLPPDVLQGVARHFEAAAAAVQIAVQKEGAATTIDVSLWGEGVPDGDKLVAEARAAFPVLASAEITTKALDTAAVPVIPTAGEGIADPEEAKQAIEEELRAKGVDGRLEVEVRDDEEGGREVEVRVTKEDPQP